MYDVSSVPQAFHDHAPPPPPEKQHKRTQKDDHTYNASPFQRNIRLTRSEHRCIYRIQKTRDDADDELRDDAADVVVFKLCLPQHDLRFKNDLRDAVIGTGM